MNDIRIDVQMPRPELLLERRYIQIARIIALKSTCPRRAVGAVLVSRDGRIVSTGYNGAPKKAPHCSLVGCFLVDNHCVRSIHAELNTLLNLEVRVKRGASLYSTSMPCIRCAGAIAQTGITAVFYDNPYGTLAEQAQVRELFDQLGVTLTQVKV